MSFINEFSQLPLVLWMGLAERATSCDVERALRQAQGRLLRQAQGGNLSVSNFAALISPAASPFLEAMAAEAHKTTIKHFGQVMRLFAPLYLSNECVNTCKYCGFSRDNAVLRLTLTIQQVQAEARYLQTEGFRNILLVAGEHPKFVSKDYLCDCVAALRSAGIPSIHLEVGPLDTEDYRPIVAAGAEGLVVYQETYDRKRYATLHEAGPKENFDFRLECPERGYAAGFRRLGVGALLGLAPWREDAIALAAHVEYLLKTCWRSQITVSVPRLRPAAGEFEPKFPISDRELVQLICALRLTFPKIGLVLSTREPAAVRDGLAPLGVTLMSAGSHTEPGGYTGAGANDLHRTTGSRRVEASTESIRSEGEHATVQFEIADTRSPGEVAARLRLLSYETVWKDWDTALCAER